MSDHHRVTVKDVAEAAGVHPGTVSRVLNPEQRHRVNEQTARRVERAARELGYAANSIARGLRTRRSLTVGVVIPDLTNPLFPPIVRGIEDRLDRAGYATLLFNTDSDPEREARGFATLSARQVDGIIVASAGPDLAPLEVALRAGQPLVLVNRRAERLAIPAVVPDDRAGMAAAVEHLVGLGHRRIACVAGPEGVSTARERAASFRESVSAHGISSEAAALVHAGALSAGSGLKPMRWLLENASGLTAVCTHNDLQALDCLAVLHDAGLRCPEDVSVVGFNDMPFAGRFDPPLTTVRFSHQEMGRIAAEMLLEQITAGSDPVGRTVVLETALVIRGSTAAPPVGVRRSG